MAALLGIMTALVFFFLIAVLWSGDRLSQHGFHLKGRSQK